MYINESKGPFYYRSSFQGFCFVSYFCFDTAVKEQNLKANPHSKLRWRRGKVLGHLVHLRCTVVRLESV